MSLIAWDDGTCQTDLMAPCAYRFPVGSRVKILMDRKSDGMPVYRSGAVKDHLSRDRRRTYVVRFDDGTEAAHFTEDRLIAIPVEPEAPKAREHCAYCGHEGGLSPATPRKPGWKWYSCRRCSADGPDDPAAGWTWAVRGRPHDGDFRPGDSVSVWTGEGRPRRWGWVLDIIGTDPKTKIYRIHQTGHDFFCFAHDMKLVSRIEPAKPRFPDVATVHRFAVGDWVRFDNAHPLRGRTGQIVEVYPLGKKWYGHVKVPGDGTYRVEPFDIEPLST